MQASAQYALDVNVPYTHVEWVEIDGNGIPMVGGVLVKPNADETFLRNLIILVAGSAVHVSVGADDVQIYNLVAYDFGGDEHLHGRRGRSRTARSTSARRPERPAASDTGSASGYNVGADEVGSSGPDLALIKDDGQTTALPEDSPSPTRSR